jgi:hypothetical protein
VFRSRVLAGLLVVAGTPAVRAAEESVPASLEARAADILKRLSADKFANVGVLKFLVRVGDGPPRDDAGDLNASLANQLQGALALANADPNFGLLDDPSGFVAANAMTDANHTTAAGRKAFFAREYPLAWGSGKAKAAGFVVGTASVSADLKTVTFRTEVFDRTGALKPLVPEWTAATDPKLLAELGYSYTLRKPLVSGGDSPATAVRDEVIRQIRATVPVERSADRKPPAPLPALAECPLRWAIRYDGKAVRPTGDTVPEPAAGVRVTFAVENPTDDTYAAVLLVNGENTLHQEQLDPAACRKWVLEPKTRVEVNGFQTDDREAVAFHVTRPDDPVPDGVRYGPHAGTFRLVVFHGRVEKSGGGPKGEASGAAAIALIRRGVHTADAKPQTLQAYQAALKLRHKDTANSRGYVVKGAAAERSETERVTFVPTSDQPVSDVSIKYLSPSK